MTLKNMDIMSEEFYSSDTTVEVIGNSNRNILGQLRKRLIRYFFSRKNAFFFKKKS